MVWLIVVTGVVVSTWPTGTQRERARVAVLALLAYLAITTEVMAGVEARWRTVLEDRGAPVLRVAVVPAFPGPFRWLGVAKTPDDILQARLWPWAVASAPRTLFDRTPPIPGLPDTEAHPAVEAFHERAKFPWRRVLKEGEVWVIEYHDLGFEDHQLGGPMMLSLRVAPSGLVESVELGHRL